MRDDRFVGQALGLRRPLRPPERRRPESPPQLKELLHNARGIRRVALLLACATAALAQVYTPGPQVLTYLSDTDDTDQPYALYLPRAYDPARKYPLVVSLHGAGSNHRLNLRRVFGRGNVAAESDIEASRYFPPLRDVDFIVASPFARGAMGYQGIAEKDVYDVLADVKRRFSIDDDRVYLTGLSMGGGGALWLGLTRPDLWAAIAPVCPASVPGVEDLAPNALHVPVHLFHGDQDQSVPVAVSRAWQKRFLDLNVRAEYVEYPGVRHNSWDFAYRNGAIFDWFAKFRRVRMPDRVRFVTRAYKYSTAYWVRIDALTPGVLASIDARFTAKNKLEIETGNLSGFTLSLAGHPQFSPALPLAVTVDGVALRAKTASFHKGAKGWAAGEAAPAGKRRGAEGPLAEAIAARHLYVYGTADSPGPEELTRRREIARRASEWSSPRARLMVNFAVRADREVRAPDLETANLILFGTRETNTLIARFAPQLPLALNASAADYSLTFIAPAGSRYIAVNSGLPWWTGAADSSAVPWRILQGFPDFVLFKGALRDAVAEGLFDAGWKVPPDLAGKMRATGAVEVR